MEINPSPRRKPCKSLSTNNRAAFDIVNAVAGLGLFLSPWLFGFSAEAYAAWNARIVGAAIAVIAAATSTLAHELAQPLTSIAAYAQGCELLVTKDRRGHGEELREALSEITQHALWAGKIVQNIGEFAKRGAEERKIEAMHALIHEATAFALAGSQRNGLGADFRFEAERDVVLADRVQIVQVLTNLVRNAVEATDGIARPHITIRTRTDDLSRLIVEVSDNGCGIAADIEEALFRPFVTSKPRGRGMGLALSKRRSGDL